MTLVTEYKHGSSVSHFEGVTRHFLDIICPRGTCLCRRRVRVYVSLQPRTVSPLTSGRDRGRRRPEKKQVSSI